MDKLLWEGSVNGKGVVLEATDNRNEAFTLLVIGRGTKLFTWKTWMGRCLNDEDLNVLAREADVFYIGLCGWPGWQKMKDLDQRERNVLGLIEFMDEYERFKEVCLASPRDPHLSREEAKPYYKKVLRAFAEKPKRRVRKVENEKYQGDDQKQRAIQQARAKLESGSA